VSGHELHGCQPEGLSRFKDDKRKPVQEKTASSQKYVGKKKCQGERLPRDIAARRPAVVPIDSPFLYRLPLPFETSFARLAWALLVLYVK
jgi:hypothetical protein